MDRPLRGRCQIHSAKADTQNIERRSARSTHGDPAAAGPWLQRLALLFAEDFLYVAHLLLNFAGDLLAGATIS